MLVFDVFTVPADYVSMGFTHLFKLNYHDFQEVLFCFPDHYEMVMLAKTKAKEQKRKTDASKLKVRTSL